MGAIDGLDLGTFGVYTFDFEFQPAAQMRESILRSCNCWCPAAAVSSCSRAQAGDAGDP